MEKATHAIWSFKEIAKLDITTLAVFDRDYRCDAEIEKFVKTCKDDGLEVIVLSRKEIENNFLAVGAITRAVNSKGKKKITEAECEQLLMEICEKYRYKVQSQLEFHENEFLKKTKGGPHSTSISETSKKRFDQDWKKLLYRLKKVPGKDAFSSLNSVLVERGFPNVTYASVANTIVRKDMEADFLALLNRLEAFVST